MIANGRWRMRRSVYTPARRNDVQAPLQVCCGFVGAAVCYRAHGHCRRNDDLGDFVQEVLAEPANTLAAFSPRTPMNASATSPTYSVILRIETSSGTSLWCSCKRWTRSHRIPP